MRAGRDRFKPGVDRSILLLLAGFLWICVGSMLLAFSCFWLHGPSTGGLLRFTGAGVLLALLIHHFGFLRVVDKNLGRILPMEGKRCLFSFMSWQSYLIVPVMVLMGVLLRHAPIPKPYLSILYTGIGLALIFSSVRYLRVLLGQLRKGA